MNKNVLNKIIIEWNTDFNDSGIIKVSDIKNQMRNYQLVYTLDKPGQIKIFNRHFTYFDEFRDKVYINNEHVELNEEGFTENVYESGEYHVYIDGFDEWEAIDYWAFRGCTALTSITIPNSVKTIATSSFYNCAGLTSITIPNSVTLIDYAAFSWCSGLTQINIPNSVKMIDRWVFYNCTGLTSITIPDSVKAIGYYAFKNCINLKTVYVKDIDKFNKIGFEDESANPTYYGAKLIELKK